MGNNAVATTETKAEPQPKFGRKRFVPGAYALDLSAIYKMPMQLNGNPSTFSEVYRKLMDSKIKEVDGFLTDYRYIAENGEEIRVKTSIEDWQLASILRTLVEVIRQGGDPYQVNWFYYTHDVSRDADESHTFFVVRGDRIILEACHFDSDAPLVLERKDDKEPTWRSHPDFDEAFEIYWYRKFYSETVTGQLMVLRPDEPILYHYERPQVHNVWQELQFATVAKMYRLLLVFLPLVIALAFPDIKVYMEVSAVVLGADFLWVCWKTRNVGKTTGT